MPCDSSRAHELGELSSLGGSGRFPTEERWSASMDLARLFTVASD